MERRYIDNRIIGRIKRAFGLKYITEINIIKQLYKINEEIDDELIYSDNVKLINSKEIIDELYNLLELDKKIDLTDKLLKFKTSIRVSYSNGYNEYIIFIQFLKLAFKVSNNKERKSAFISSGKWIEELEDVF